MAGSTNLLPRRTSLVGRSEQLTALEAELSKRRLVTLTGSGGCGKTRLAHEVGSSKLDEFPDGVWIAELAPVVDPARVATELAGVLGLREHFGTPLLDTLADQVRELHALIIVDNCEQVIDGVRSTVDHLLQHCPQLHVLATSREPLGLEGEVTWRVPSLDVEAGVELFVARAQAVRPGFSPDEAESSVIAEIVGRLDGIPLAIELAAARVRMMSPARIAAALDDRFRLLTGGSRTSLARQQTIEASVAWSYGLLDPVEQWLARRLSVMPSFTLEAAEHVGADDDRDRYEVLDTLSRLVDKSVIQVDHGRDGRYRFLESIRQFLQLRLVEAGEAEQARTRHLEYFLAMAEDNEPRLALRDSVELLELLEIEHDNLEAALEFADTSGQREMALRLATALALFWELRGHVGRASRWFARLLEHQDPELPELRGRACWGAAHVALYSGDVETMLVRAPEALALAEECGDDWARARALNTVGFATAITAPDQARDGIQQSIELARRTGDDWAVMNSQKMLTVAGWAAHDQHRAFEDLEPLRHLAEGAGAGYFLAWYHGLTGFFLAHRGEGAEARTHLEAAIELSDELGEPVTGSMSKGWLYALDVAEGRYEQAQEHSAALLRRARSTGGALAVADLLATLGRLAIGRGDPDAAIDLLAPVHEAERAHGIPLMVATMGIVLASARRRTGDLRAATELLDDLEGLATTLGNPSVRAHVDLERARVAIDRHAHDEAEQLAHDALAAFVGLEQRPGIVAVLEVLAVTAAAAGSNAEALRCLAAAAAERARLGIVALPPDAAALAALGDELRSEPVTDEVADPWDQGEQLTLAEAVEYVSRARGERKRPDHGWKSLTPTELRVVELVAQGLTNPQIAEKMFIARGTVKVHVSHVLSKLGVANRAEVAAMATRRSVRADTDRGARANGLD